MFSARPDVLYVLAHGFAARMVLQSSLMDQLKTRGVSVAALASSGDADHFKEQCASRGVQAIPAPTVAGALLGQYGTARRYLFEDYESNAALNSKHLYEVEHPDVHPALALSARMGKAVNRVCLRWPLVPRVAAAAEAKLSGSRALRRLLTELKPKMVVSTYPVAWLEAFALVEAQRLGIPTVGHLLSWDNISCKGRFVAVPERFISWGPIMTEELGDYYGVPKARVFETGVAHFDDHTRPVSEERIAKHLRALELDPARPYIFLGMSAGFFAPKEVDIVEWLASQARAGKFGEGVQLLVRPHPQNVRGPMADADMIQRLRRVAGPQVAVDLPGVVSDTLDMAEGDMARLVALLRGASVTVNSGSTLTIDALIHDRPVILTSFDASSDLPIWMSARRLVEFPHLKKLLSYGGVRTVGSFSELERAICDYLKDPALDREGRTRALRAECGTPDGEACTRIAEALSTMLKR